MGAPVAKTHGMRTGGPSRFGHSELKATAQQQDAVHLRQAT